MLKIDRLEFPRKYSIPNWLKLLVLILVIAGVWIHNCSQDKLEQELELSNLKIKGSSRVHVEVEYSIHNKSRTDRDAWLLLKVFDAKDEVLASTLFLVNLRAGEKKDMLKFIDKLSRPLENGEKPKKATLEIFKRKVLS